MKRIAIALTLLVLAGCGARKDLRPVAGEQLPPAPLGAAARPTPEQLMQPDAAARPSRSDEVLTQSEPRQPDRFDLPPP